MSDSAVLEASAVEKMGFGEGKVVALKDGPLEMILCGCGCYGCSGGCDASQDVSDDSLGLDAFR